MGRIFKRLQALIDKYTLNTDGLIFNYVVTFTVRKKIVMKLYCNDKSITLLRKVLKKIALNIAWLKNGTASNDGLTWCDREIIPKLGVTVFLQQIIYVFIYLKHKSRQSTF